MKTKIKTSLGTFGLIVNSNLTKITRILLPNEMEEEHNFQPCNLLFSQSKLPAWMKNLSNNFRQFCEGKKFSFNLDYLDLNNISNFHKRGL